MTTPTNPEMKLTDEMIRDAAKDEIKNKSELPFYHKENVNIDLCRQMWINGAQWANGKNADPFATLRTRIQDEIDTMKWPELIIDQVGGRISALEWVLKLLKP